MNAKLGAAISALLLVLGVAASPQAFAIVAGVIDPNLPTSPFSGVVSINIRYDGQSFICSGTLVSARQVVTSAHCLDTTGQGTLIDLTKPGSDVRVVFNSEPNVGDPGRAIITASSVSMNPDFQGFGNCPYATTTDFCVNDDIGVITMSADAPSTAAIYPILYSGVTTGQVFTLAGYGRGGDGINGYTTGPDFRIRRIGGNIMDLFDLNDEQHFLAGPQEVWYADFDGNGVDSFCTLYQVCTPILNNEAAIGGGDNGGPAFLFDGSTYYLLGTLGFGGTFASQTPGTFGTYFGGMLLSAYADYLRTAIGTPVPEPATLALLGLGLAGLGFARRK